MAATACAPVMILGFVLTDKPEAIQRSTNRWGPLEVNLDEWHDV